MDLEQIRKQFPILNTSVHGKPLIYLDNGASSQKPERVVEALISYYRRSHANIHRGVHYLSQHATEAYENTRQRTANFLNAADPCEIIFTRGTTESINLVAHSFTKQYIRSGDEILISAMEHHSNIVPWQMACEASGAILKVIPLTDRGELDMEAFSGLLNAKTKIVGITHVSNTLGTVNPIEAIITQAHLAGAAVLVDGAQAVAHTPVDVQALDVDFYVFSSHKMYGPTGIGFLYGKSKYLNEMPPYMGGGDMIRSVSFEKTTYNDLPHKFEAGTPNIADGIAFSAALDFIEETGWATIMEREKTLMDYGMTRLGEIPGLRFIGESEQRSGVISFLVNDIHPYDMGTILDQLGIAVRTGHHCTEPIMTRYGIPGTVRASFAVYNTEAEIDTLVAGINKAINMLS